MRRCLVFTIAFSLAALAGAQETRTAGGGAGEKTAGQDAAQPATQAGAEERSQKDQQAEELLARVLRQWRPPFDATWMLLSVGLRGPIDDAVGPAFEHVTFRMGLLNRAVERSAKNNRDVQALLKLGPFAAAACNRAFARADPVSREAGILAALLAATGDRGSVPLLIEMLARSGKLEGERPEQTYVASMRALWQLTGRRLRKNSAGWKLWWQAVKSDFLLPSDRVQARITERQVQRLAAKLGQRDDELLRERLLVLGPNALPYLLKELSQAQGDMRYRLGWVIDELGMAGKMPRGLRRAYFGWRLTIEKPGGETGKQVLRRALMQQNFADFCRTTLEAPHDPSGAGTDDLLAKMMKDKRGEIDAAVPVLVPALTDPDQSVRHRAAALAGMIGSFTDARPPQLVDALVKGWLMRPGVGGPMPLAVSRFDTPGVRTVIKEGLWSKRKEVIADSATMAGDTGLMLGPERQATGLRLAELTAHSSRRIREASVWTLRRRAPAFLVPHLPRLCEDKLEFVRRACAEAMGELQNPDQGKLLVGLAFGKERTVRWAALKALGSETFRGAIPSLVPLLKNPEHRYNDPAMWAIANAGGAEAAAVLIQEIREGNTIGGTIYAALEKVTGKRFRTKDEAMAWWWTFPMDTPAAKSVDLRESQVQSLWDSLASRELLKAHRAAQALTAGGQKTVVFLASRLKPTLADDQRIKTLLGQLDSDKHAVREEASQELSRIGRVAEASLRSALKGDQSAEMRGRAEPLLAACSKAYPVLTEAMRTVRGTRVLEWIGTPEAVEVLRSLSKGTPETYATEQAKAALARLDRAATQPATQRGSNGGRK